MRDREDPAFCKTAGESGAAKQNFIGFANCVPPRKGLNPRYPRQSIGVKHKHMSLLGKRIQGAGQGFLVNAKFVLTIMFLSVGGP
jgi:hypothetical protein